MSVNWWAWLPPWVQAFLSRIPSPVIEVVSGLVVTTISWAIVWGFLSVLGIPLHHDPGAFVVMVAIAHGLSAFYEAVLDPNGWEWKDVLQREAGLVLGLLVLWLVWVEH